MYFIWFLAAAGVLAVGIALKKLFFPSDKRTLSPFQQSRPVPDLSSPPAVGMQEKVRSGLLKLANAPDSEFVPASAHDAGPLSHGFASQRFSEPVASARSSVAGGAGQGVNRISTWGDRRLFSEFRGILSEDTNQLEQVVPDELPMRDEELLFGGITSAVAQLLPESAGRREAQRKNLTGAGYFSRASWMNLTALRFVLAFCSVVFLGIPADWARSRRCPPRRNFRNAPSLPAALVQTQRGVWGRSWSGKPRCPPFPNPAHESRWA